MTKAYSGICVGGPMEGLSVDNDHHLLHAAIPPETAYSWQGVADPSVKPVTEYFTYRFVEGVFGRYWIPTSVRALNPFDDESWAIRLIIDQWQQNVLKRRGE